MKPDGTNNSQGGMSLSQQGPVDDSSKNHDYRKSQEAAADIIRSQISNIYENDPAKSPTIEQPKLDYINPYERNHTDRPQPTTNDWKQYHTAWQNYYQKYYEGYYKHTQQQQNTNANHYFTQTKESEPEKTQTEEELVFDMRQKLLRKVQNSATKIRKSRHFIPITAGLVVILIFAFLQYNRFIFASVAAYISPGNIDPQNIVIDPNANLTVTPEPRLIIPKINVDVPVMYDVGNDQKSQFTAMTKGVAHFSIPGANSHPGEIGNTVIAGHSSNDLFDSGEYKFIFVQLEKLEVGDTIYANYKSKRYTYTVTKKEVVKPKDVNKLVYPTNKPMMTLITCVPLGTALNRLLVTAEQVSPDPAKSTKPPKKDNSTNSNPIPGNSPTFLERLFGA